VEGAVNQQERPSIHGIPVELGSFLAGFALGEGSFMVVCRRRADYPGRWRISAAFNVSQRDRAPLELFQRVLGCGTIRKAGNGGWYFEVNRLTEIHNVVLPFFERFPLVGSKAASYAKFAEAVRLLSKSERSQEDLHRVLQLREQMNGHGNRRYEMEGILRDHTPDPG
jgi:hypothetical protein